MTNTLITWLILSASVWIAAAVLPGMRVSGLGGALWAGAIFGLLNLLVGWLLFGILGIATLGLGFLLAFLTRFVVDAILLKITDVMTRKLTVTGMGTLLLAALIMSGVGTLGHWAVEGLGR